MSKFRREEYERQAAYFASREGARAGHEGNPVILAPESARANFDPRFADDLERFFAYSDERGAQKIDWHTRANHGASSQACCVNFLFPMARQADLVSKWVDHLLGIEGSRAKSIDRRCDEDWYITFEWFPETDYLNEAGPSGRRARGSNSTSVDAAIRFVHKGAERLLLVEWKYTESYGSSRTASQLTGDPTRIARYTNIWKRPHGPIRADVKVALEDFFLEPWYQLLRQQMLAYHCEVDPLSDFDKVNLVHVSPRFNESLKVAKGKLAATTNSSNVFEGFAGLLDPAFRDRFKSVDTATAFSFEEFLSHPSREWLRERYPSLF